MIFDTQNRKNTLIRAIVCVLIGVLGVYLLLTPLLAKASNAYISNIIFYKNIDGYNHIKFFVNTTFVYETDNDTTDCGHLYGFYKRNDGYYHGIYYAGSLNVCLDRTFTAGNWYDMVMTINQNNDPADRDTNTYTASDYLDRTGDRFGGANANFDPIWSDDEDYYFTEYPSLTISYPLDEAEIASAFYITGSYTLPVASELNKLMAYFGYDVSGETRFYEFYQDVSPPSGSVNIRVSGLPVRSYVLGYSFINTSDENDYYMVLEWYDIHILESIPPELPDGETPPLVFDILGPASYYTAHSSYASSTLLFDNLGDALEPIILTIGSNLTFFSSKFEQSKAQETGESIAGGVLVVRTYANNLNTFFSDLPIAQALFLYLLLLVVVAVFRIAKNLINLIKP